MAKRFTVTIKKWAKHQRKDVKRPSWFALSNRLIEDPDFFDFSAEEFKAWIYILSQASQKMSSKFEINSAHAERVCGIAESSLESAMKKLKHLGALDFDVTSTSLERHADVTPHNKTRQDKTEQDKNTGASVEKISPPPEVRNLIGVYCDLWKTRYRSEESPPIGGKVAGQFKTLVRDFGARRSEELVRAYLSMPDQWFLTKRHDITTLLSNLNAVAQFADSGRMITRTELRAIDGANALASQLERIKKGEL